MSIRVKTRVKFKVSKLDKLSEFYFICSDSYFYEC
jgi:hypothetical protein